jgi:hypothetical protein
MGWILAISMGIYLKSINKKTFAFEFLPVVLLWPLVLLYIFIQAFIGIGLFFIELMCDLIENSSDDSLKK